MAYSNDLFKNPATQSKAKQFGLIGVENDELTLKGLIQKAIEWDEGEHGIEKFIYNQLKKDIEKAGGKMPPGIRITENKMKIRESFHVEDLMTLYPKFSDSERRRFDNALKSGYFVPTWGIYNRPLTSYDRTEYPKDIKILTFQDNFQNKYRIILLPNKYKNNYKGKTIFVYKKFENENKLGESKMKITRSELKKWIKEAIQEETEYQKFFRSALDKFGVKSPADLSDDKKKEFFDYIDANWKGEKENEVLEPVSPARGNPLKSVKAKKAQRILAQPYVPQKESKEVELIRKLVREELSFLMFADKNGSAGHKVQKRRKNMGVGV